MTDAPGDYDAVNVDVVDVKLNAMPKEGKKKDGKVLEA